MTQTSPQTKSFIILAIIAVVGTAGSYAYSHYRTGSQKEKNLQVTRYPKPSGSGLQDQNVSAEDLSTKVDTSLWKEYTDSSHALSFKHNPDWKVMPGKTSSGWFVLQVDPGPKYDNMKIFVSNNGYYAMDGLPSTEEQIGDLKAINVVDMLYGLRSRNYYYTFDLGASVSLQPQFKAMIKTVRLLD